MQFAMSSSAALAEQAGGFECRTSSGTPSCADCGSISYSKQWEAAFDVRLCNDCRAGYPLIAKVSSR